MKERYTIVNGKVQEALVSIDEDGTVFVVPEGARTKATITTIASVFETESEARAALAKKAGRRLWCVIGKGYGPSPPVVLRAWCVQAYDARRFIITDSKAGGYNDQECSAFESKEAALGFAKEMLTTGGQLRFDYAARKGSALRRYREEVSLCGEWAKRLVALNRKFVAAGMKPFAPEIPKRAKGKKRAKR